MFKYLSSLFISLLFFIFVVSSVHAQAGAFTFTVNPIKPEYPASYTVLIKTSSGNAFFKSEDKYIIRVAKQTGNQACSAQGLNVGANHPRYKADITESGAAILFTDVNKEGDGACLGPGDYKFSLYAQNTDASNLLGTISYTITQSGGGSISVQPSKDTFTANEQISVSLVNARKGQYYAFWWDGARTNVAHALQATEDGNILNVPLTRSGGDFTKSGVKKICVMNTSRKYTNLPATSTCEASANINYKISADPNAAPVANTLSCSVLPSNPTAEDSISFLIKNGPPNTSFRADLNQGDQNTQLTPIQTDASGNGTFKTTTKTLPEGSYNLFVYNSGDNQRLEGCSPAFTVGKIGSKKATTVAKKQTCADTGDCSVASGKYCDNGSLSTAIGCVPLQLNTFINALLAWTAGIAGGIAFLLMIFGSLQMVTSQGNPEQLKKGREQFIAAISGLLFIIFSITLLQIIGADILGIPGFTR